MKRYETPVTEIVKFAEEVMFSLVGVSVVTESNGIEEGGEI